MNRQLSAYLNLLRVLAAFEVFFAHICIWNLSCGMLSAFSDLGDDGVITFFVLSGYVIAYTTDVKDDTAEKFAVSRMTRIYSVVVPAMALTIGLEWTGRILFPSIYHTAYNSYQFRHIGLYLPLWLTFSSEFWHLDEPIFVNGAFWSLCFEVWFYIGFATWSFLRGVPRWGGLVLLAVLVGPKIDLIAPLWLAGAGAYHLQQRVALSRRTAAPLVVLTAIVYLGVIHFGIDIRLSEVVNSWFHGYPRAHLQMAWKAPGYLVLALLVAANIFCMKYAEIDVFARLARPIGWVASFTFSFYLVHLPLLRFYSALFRHATGSILFPAVLTVITAAAFGQVTERRTRPWRRVFTRLLAVRVFAQ